MEQQMLKYANRNLQKHNRYNSIAQLSEAAWNRIPLSIFVDCFLDDDYTESDRKTKKRKFVQGLSGLSWDCDKQL